MVVGLQQQYEDITHLWLDSHAHLKPQIEQSQEQTIDWLTCPSCGADKAVEVAVNLQLDEEHWWQGAVVLYCISCDRVYVSLTAKAEYVKNALPHYDAMPSITAVNARLWMHSPTLLNIEPTTRCNFDCWYCVGRDMEQGDIEEKNFTKMLDNYADLKVLSLVGEGEPFLHKGFFNMAQQAIDRGIKIVTTTNGSTLSTSMVKKICETGIHYVSVSIDSVNPEQFAATRIKGELKKVLAGIQRLKKYRDDNGYQYPKIGLKGTLFDYSKTQLPEITQKAMACGVDIMEGFQPLNPKESYIKIYPQEHRHQLDAIGDVVGEINKSLEMIKNEYDITGLEEFSNKENMHLLDCGIANGIRKNCDERWLYSLFKGDITPCCQIKEAFSSRWNLFENKVKEILRDPDYENIRFNLWNGFFLPQCKGCYKT